MQMDIETFINTTQEYQHTLADLETDFFPDAPRPPFPPFPPFPAPLADILIVICVWVLVVGCDSKLCLCSRAHFGFFPPFEK
jgi:hypothetical protein